MKFIWTAKKEYTGETYRIWLKNENIISYRNGEVDVMAPDLICMIGEDGNPVTTLISAQEIK